MEQSKSFVFPIESLHVMKWFSRNQKEIEFEIGGTKKKMPIIFASFLSSTVENHFKTENVFPIKIPKTKKNITKESLLESFEIISSLFLIFFAVLTNLKPDGLIHQNLVAVFHGKRFQDISGRRRWDNILRKIKIPCIIHAPFHLKM